MNFLSVLCIATIFAAPIMHSVITHAHGNVTDDHGNSTQSAVWATLHSGTKHEDKMLLVAVLAIIFSAIVPLFRITVQKLLQLDTQMQYALRRLRRRLLFQLILARGIAAHRKFR